MNVADGVVGTVADNGMVRVFVGKLDERSGEVEAVCRFVYTQIATHILSQQDDATVATGCSDSSLLRFREFRVVSWKGTGELFAAQQDAKRLLRAKHRLTLEAVHEAASSLCSSSAVRRSARSHHSVIVRSRHLRERKAAAAQDGRLDNAAPTDLRGEAHLTVPPGRQASPSGGVWEAGEEDHWIHIEISLKSGRLVVHHARNGAAAALFVSMLAQELKSVLFKRRRRSDGESDDHDDDEDDDDDDDDQ
jgi:hypothetical protein